MISSLLSSIVGSLKSFINFISDLPLLIKGRVNYIKKYLAGIRYNLSNLTDSNLDLGKYHLRIGNYNDAIFRFKLIDSYLDKNNPVANYWLGWGYFFKGKYNKALYHLEKAGTEDIVGLRDFIQNIDNLTEVPEEICRLHRDIMASSYIDRFDVAANNIPLKMVSELNAVITKLSEHYSILELGSNIGLVGFEINQRMADGFSLTGVETSAELIQLQSLYLRQDQIYNSVIQQDITSYLLDNETKHDIIISLDGLSYAANLEPAFNLIKSRLKSGGYFTLAFKTSLVNKFLTNYLEFTYNPAEIRNTLIKVGFQIKAELEVKSGIRNNYTIFSGIVD